MEMTAPAVSDSHQKTTNTMRDSSATGESTVVECDVFVAPKHWESIEIYIYFEWAKAGVIFNAHCVAPKNTHHHTSGFYFQPAFEG